MMYSGKPPLRSFATGGTPGSKDVSTGLAGLTQQRATASENCDPNHPNELVSKTDFQGKAESPSVSNESYQCAGNGSVLEPAGSDTEGVERRECEAAGKLESPSKEVNRPTARSSSSSPTKVAIPHHHGHSPRPHFCRSPRCASNNPDYATPAQGPPRKYLVSKRHLLPGAICTKDPRVLASQTQESAIPHAPSTGKPPKPSRKLENVFRQPSFLNNASDRSPAPLSYETSPTRIPKPPSRSPSLHHPTISPQTPFSVISPPCPPAAESHPIPFSPATRQPALEKSLTDEEVSQERFSETDVSTSKHSSRVVSHCPLPVVALESVSPRDVDAGESLQASVSGVQLESWVISGAEQPLSQQSSSQRPTSTTSTELTELLNSDKLSPVSDVATFPATPSPVPLSADVEDVTEKLAQKLALENVEEVLQVTDCNPREEISSAITQEERTDFKEDLTISRDNEAEEHFSKLRGSEKDIPEENADGGNYEGDMNLGGEGYEAVKNADAGNIQADKNADGGNCQAEKNAGRGDCQAEKNAGEGHCQAERNADEGHCQADKDAEVGNCQAEQDADGGEYQSVKNSDGDDNRLRINTNEFDSALSSEDMQGKEGSRGRSIASYIEELENSQNKHTERQCEAPKYVRGKGRQLWRSDCRDSREVVFLKQTPQKDRGDGDWMVDSILEGAISKLNPSGKGRVRVLVEAFESLMNHGGDTDLRERRASRVWCLNRMEKGEVDEDGEEFEDGDQRVDCYEVSGDGLELRASMRLSLGGGNRLPVYYPDDDGDEIEMSAIQKVQDWDDDCRQSSSVENLDGQFRRSQSQPDEPVVHEAEAHSEAHSEDTELTFGGLPRRISFAESHTVLNDDYRLSDDLSCEARTESKFGCYTSDGGKQGADARSTFSLDLDSKYETFRRRRYWKPSSVNLQPTGPSSCGGAEKDQRVIRGTLSEPFHLLTEERGMMKEFQFSQKLEQMLAEEERLRNPIAQGLPWTTDEPEAVPKPPVKEQTKPVEFRHYSDSRAIERAEFDSYVSKRTAYMEEQRQEEERLRELAEQEEIKRLRRDMVPRAQLMPFFDQPFIPTRSSKRLTVPKEPTFLNRQHKRAKCIVWQQQQQQQQQHSFTYERPHVFN